MITGSGFLLLVRSLVFLVDDNQPQVPVRQEYGGSYPEHDGIRIRPVLPPPHFGTGVVRHSRVVDTHPVAEYPPQPLHDLHRQGDFRQQVQHLFSLPYRFFHQMDIYFRFPRRGDSLQQHAIFFPEVFPYLLQGLFLGSRQGVHFPRFFLRPVQTAHLDSRYFQDTAFA